MNGDSNGFSKMTVGGMIGGLVGIFSIVGGIVYKSVDDRIEVRRQDLSKVEAKQIDHEGKIERALSQEMALEKELLEIRMVMREIQLEQARRTQYIPKKPQ